MKCRWPSKAAAQELHGSVKAQDLLDGLIDLFGVFNE